MRAGDILTALEKTLAIEKISLQLLSIVYDRLIVALPNARGSSLQDLLFKLYSEYANRSVAEIQVLCRQAVERMSTAWNARFPTRRESTLTR